MSDRAFTSTPSFSSIRELAVTTRIEAGLGLSLACVLFAGCDEFNVERTGGPVMNEAQQSADALSPEAAPPAPAGNSEPPAAPPMAGPEAAPAAAPAATADEESGTHVGKTTKEVLDAKELASDPNWSVAAEDSTQVTAFTITGTAYNRAAALAGTANLGQWLKQQQALNGKWPTYQELQDYIAKNPVDMPALREYQHYGYDETTGKVVVLENQQEKAKRRGELGLPAGE